MLKKPRRACLEPVTAEDRGEGVKLRAEAPSGLFIVPLYKGATDCSER
jgi:hypothetical protein